MNNKASLGNASSTEWNTNSGIIDKDFLTEGLGKVSVFCAA